MKVTRLLLVVIAGLCSATCDKESRGKRRAWHTFSNKEKAAYIDAELCLMKKPAVHNLPGAQTRFDEFQAIHQLQSYATHFVGAFLPFHRAMLFAHEEAMRKECGYQGRQPFWQEQLDAGHFNTSVVFDAEFGFGGNGSAPSKCITDGPFKDYTLHLGPNYNYTDWCITRNVNDNISSTTAQDFVDECLEKPDWLSHWPCVETNPHLGGHGGVGELMFDPIASPGDPLFYLHHTWLDKIWADWQVRDLPKRLTEMGGNNVQNPATIPIPFPPRPGNPPPETGADGDPGLETTLGHVLNMYGNGPNRTIADVMDIWNGVLCYEYVEPY